MKRVREITAMTCLLCMAVSCATQKMAYKERFGEAKGLALCVCIARMNKFVDSSSVITKDHSIGYFVDASSLLSLDEVVEIKDYVERECMNYWGETKNPEANAIGYSAWRFYSSPELDDFIREVLKKNTGDNGR